MSVAGANAILVRSINEATRALPSGTLQKMYRQAHADGDRLRATNLWEAWVAAKCREGDRPDRLRRDAGTPTERFWATVIEGLDDHLFWDGKFDSRGRPLTISHNQHWVLAQRFAWRLKHGPTENVYIVYATCGEENCLNVEHLAREHRAKANAYREETMIGALQACALAIGHPPTVIEFGEWRPRTGSGRRGLPTSTIIYARFGSWPRAIRAAGLEPRRETAGFARVHTDDAALAALRAFAEERGHAPRFEEWERGGYRPSYSTIRRRFGTWAAALAKAGLA